MKDYIEASPIFEIVGQSNLGLVAFHVMVLYLLVLNTYCFKIDWVLFSPLSWLLASGIVYYTGTKSTDDTAPAESE